MATYTDIKMQGDDIVTDDAGQPIQIYDRDVIAQDIGHALRESGHLEALIAERSVNRRALIFKEMRILIENDPRTVPGTSSIKEQSPGALLITADTEFGKINIATGAA